MVTMVLVIYGWIFAGLSLFALVATAALGILSAGWALRRAAIVLHRYWRFI